MTMIISKEYSLDELREQAADALGVQPGIRLRLSNGAHIVIPHPMFVDDDVIEGMRELGESSDPIAIAKLLLGEEWHELRANGGRSSDVVAAWTIMNKQMQATMPGTGDPTQSGT